jgi:hypothetical protein
VAKLKKSPNFYTKAQFESPKHVHQTTFENLKISKTNYVFKLLIRVNFFKCLSKNAQNIVICLGYSSFSKYYNEPKK